MRSSVPSTFSIVGFDPKTKDLGVAVESRFVAVGAVVPLSEAGVGAVATQSYANTTFGPKALGMMKQRVAPKDVLQRLVKADKEAARRQVGLVDARGRPASYTGKECFHWAGHVVGQHYACQGNLLAGADVVKEMGRAFERTQGDLPVRLLAALSEDQRAVLLLRVKNNVLEPGENIRQPVSIVPPANLPKGSAVDVNISGVLLPLVPGKRVPVGNGYTFRVVKRR